MFEKTKHILLQNCIGRSSSCYVVVSVVIVIVVVF